MISTVVLARLLTPRDFGLIAMVTTFSLLFTSFGVTGFTEVVLQRAEINRFLASNLFWINVGIGLILMVAFAAAGSSVGRFYRDSRVAPVAVAMSVSIFLSSMSVQHLALLKRAMRFSEVTANDILARLVSVAVTIFLSWRGWNYWALVAGAVTLPLATGIGAWSLCRWIPNRPRRTAGTLSTVKAAFQIYGRFSFNYLARNLDNLLVGWRFGPEALGYYKKAYDLFLLPASQLLAPLTAVVVSVLSRLNGQSAQYRRYFLRGLALMAFVGMGLGADLTLVGRDVIRVILGPGWEPAGRIFTFFGPGIGVMFIYGTHGWIHLSIGTADRWFRWVVVEFAVTGLLFMLGLSWGPVGIATAWTLSFWILIIPAFWYAGRPIQLGIGSIVGAVWRYIFAALVAGCATALILPRLSPSVSVSSSVQATFRCGVISLSFGILYLAAVILFHWGCAPLYQFAGLFREMLPWGGARTSRAAVPITCIGDDAGAILTPTEPAGI